MGNRIIAGAFAAALLASPGAAAAMVAELDAPSVGETAPIVDPLAMDVLVAPATGPELSIIGYLDGRPYVMGRDAWGVAYVSWGAAPAQPPPPAAYDVEFNAGVLPQPASWAMMMIGFFGAGWLLRRFKDQMAAAWPTQG